MATVFNAKTIVKRGNLSKQHICPVDDIPQELKILQEELVEVVLIERSAQLLSGLKKLPKEMSDDDGL